MRSIIAALICAISSPTNAQSACDQREKIVSELAAKYGEARQGAGLNNNNSVVEIFASLESGTWTMLITTPNGVSCIVAAGKAWESSAVKAGKGV